MNKIQKRIRKLSRHSSNALVVGEAFGNLSILLEIFNTVFIISEKEPPIKARNLVYRENISNLNNITDVGAIFYDLSQIHQLESLQHFWSRNNSNIFIEGNEVIGREHSRSLYDSGWRATSQQGLFHVWEKQI
jgi:hypothetical protein